VFPQRLAYQPLDVPRKRTPNGAGTLATDPEAFIREVDEDLRHDRVTRFWRSYGVYVVAAAVAVVAGTAGWSGWRYWDESRQERDALAFDRALEQAAGVPEAATTALAAVADEASTGYAMVARLTAAQIDAAGGKTDEALALVEQVAADGDVPDLYRDLATLLAVTARADSASPDALLVELRPLTASGPWRHSAREVMAGVLLRAGDRAGAVATLRDMLQDAGTPEAMRGRIGETLAALGETQAEGAGG
jgi:hypothetical protein